MPGLQGPPQTTANLSQGCPPAAQGGAFFDKGTQGYPATQPSPEAPELSGTELYSAWTQVQGRPSSLDEAQDGVGTVTCLKSHVEHSSWEHAGGTGMAHRGQQLPPAATASCLSVRAPVPVLMVSRPCLALPTTKCPF